MNLTRDTKHPLWRYNSLSSIHIELSSKCNAACPGCARFVMNSPVVNPGLVQTEITFDNFVKWFPVALVSRIYNWVICGTYGDPLACKDIHEILEYICEHSPGNIQLNTNGGLKTSALYEKIGRLFATKKQFDGVTPHRVVTFSVDGLADTNHIYRRNVVWNKVWENMMSYVGTGAEAHWDFLQFKHNVHQVEEAQALAKKYGINFLLKNPFGVDKTAMPVYNKELEFEYNIEHAINNGYPSYIPAGPDYVAPLPEVTNDSGCINCMSKRQAPEPYSRKEVVEIYVDAQGNVLPCCFVGYGLFVNHMSDAVQVQKIQKDMNTTNSLHHHSLYEILENKTLDVWSNSWDSKSIAVCWKHCGKNIEKNREIDNLFIS